MGKPQAQATPSGHGRVRIAVPTRDGRVVTYQVDRRGASQTTRDTAAPEGQRAKPSNQ